MSEIHNTFCEVCRISRLYCIVREIKGSRWVLVLYSARECVSQTVTGLKKQTRAMSVKCVFALGSGDAKARPSLARPSPFLTIRSVLKGNWLRFSGTLLGVVLT